MSWKKRILILFILAMVIWFAISLVFGSTDNSESNFKQVCLGKCITKTICPNFCLDFCDDFNVNISDYLNCSDNLNKIGGQNE